MSLKDRGSSGGLEIQLSSSAEQKYKNLIDMLNSQVYGILTEAAASKNAHFWFVVDNCDITLSHLLILRVSQVINRNVKLAQLCQKLHELQPSVIQLGVTKIGAEKKLVLKKQLMETEQYKQLNKLTLIEGKWKKRSYWFSRKVSYQQSIQGLLTDTKWWLHLFNFYSW